MAKASKKKTPPKTEPAPPAPPTVHRCGCCGMQMKTEAGNPISALCPGCENKQGATDEQGKPSE